EKARRATIGELLCPGPGILGNDPSAGEDIASGHEARAAAAPADQDLDAVLAVAQQDQARRVARPYASLCHLLAHAHSRPAPAPRRSAARGHSSLGAAEICLGTARNARPVPLLLVAERSRSWRRRRRKPRSPKFRNPLPMLHMLPGRVPGERLPQHRRRVAMRLTNYRINLRPGHFRIKSRLSDFRIKSRIYAGFGALIVLGTAVAGIGVWQMLTLDHQVRQLVQVSENASRNQQTSRLIETLRRMGADYKTTSGSDAVAEFSSRGQLAANLLDKSAASDEDLSDLYHNASKILGAASGNFDQLVKLTQAGQASQKQLFAAIDALSAASDHLLHEADQDANQDIGRRAQLVATSVLSLRASAWRFLATRDATAVPPVKLDAATAGMMLSALQKAPGADKFADGAKPVGAALKDFQTSFDSLSQAMIAADKLYDGVMRPQFKQVDDIDDTVQQSLSGELDTTKDSTLRTILTTLAGQGVLAAFAFIFGLVCAFLIGRSIVRPVSGMTAAMERLANGDTSAPIPAQDFKDEIGAMAKAVGVFKESMIEAERLAAQQREEQGQKAERQKAM